MAESPTASPIMMNRYVTLQALGDGTYGSVVLGQRVDTGEKVGGQGKGFDLLALPSEN